MNLKPDNYIKVLGELAAKQVIGFTIISVFFFFFAGATFCVRPLSTINYSSSRQEKKVVYLMISNI